MRHCFLALTFVLFAADSRLRAGLITVQNPSFESPVLSVGTTGTPTNWDVVSAAAFYPNIPSDVHSVPDGHQVGLAGFSDFNPGFLFQDLGVPVDPGSLYELDVFVGGQFNAMSNYLIELTAGGATIGSTSGSFLGNGTFSQVSVVAVGSGSGNLGIRLSDLGGFRTSQTLFDDVQLQVNTVPEPASFLLLAMGIIGACGFARSRRVGYKKNQSSSLNLRP